jgi:hypothetical protein
MNFTRTIHNNKDLSQITIFKNHKYNISPQLRGGLGNQLFQIASLYSYAYDMGINIVIEVTELPGVGHKTTYQGQTGNMLPVKISDIFPNINSVDGPKYYWKQYICQEKDSHKFIPLKDYVPKNADKIKVIGTFMSHYYFNSNREKILDLFSFSPKINEYILNKYSKLLNIENSISVHVRRGDYIKRIKYGDKRFCLLGIDYYKKAFDIFNNMKDIKYIFFKEDEESKKYIETELVPLLNGSYIIIDYESSPVDLALMSLCKNNIIANSTFSFWGAYLNRNKAKIVVAPSEWKNGGDEKTLKHRVLPEWTIIKCECITDL